MALGGNVQNCKTRLDGYRTNLLIGQLYTTFLRLSLPNVVGRQTERLSIHSEHFFRSYRSKGEKEIVIHCMGQCPYVLT